MSISLQHPGTGRVKVLAGRLELVVLFWRNFLGLPLFKRGLIVWGSAMLVFDISALIVGWIGTDSCRSLYLWMSVIGIAASLFFGLKANDMAARHAVASGWESVDQHRRWFD